MRILIYSETETAKKQLEVLRAEGHHASLRNPQYYAGEIEQADLVLAEKEEILKSYKEANVGTEFLIEAVSISTTEQETVFEPLPVIAEEIKEQFSQPVKKRRR